MLLRRSILSSFTSRAAFPRAPGIPSLHLLHLDELLQQPVDLFHLRPRPSRFASGAAVDRWLVPVIELMIASTRSICFSSTAPCASAP